MVRRLSDGVPCHDRHCHDRHTDGVLHRHPLLSLLTGGYLAFVAWLTLTPQPLGPDDQQLIVRALDALHRRGYAESIDYARLEFLANIALFVPIGMFLLLLFGAGQWWLAGIGSFLLTAAIETAQRQIPGRVSDDRDLLANTMGGLVGIAVALVLTMPATLRRRRRRRAVSSPVSPRSARR
ncbi:MAG: hypothetical protein JWM84_471 [Nocardioides sp.]|nr:hypothetical protein [Nocardioides sp.]